MLTIAPSDTRILHGRDLRFDQFREPPLRNIPAILPGNLSVGGVDQPQEWPEILLADLNIPAFAVDQGPALGGMVEGVDQQHIVGWASHDDLPLAGENDAADGPFATVVERLKDCGERPARRRIGGGQIAVDCRRARTGRRSSHLRRQPELSLPMSVDS